VYVHSIPRGTNLNIILEDGTELAGVFDGNIDHIKFYVLCPEILQNISTLCETEPTVMFSVKESGCYTFKSKILGKSGFRKGPKNETVDFVVVTPFKEVFRRENMRIKLTMDVRICGHGKDSALICDAISVDVSKSGIRLWSNYNLNTPTNTFFNLEYVLTTGKKYVIPAKLMRSSQNNESRVYEYDYGFFLDFTNIPDQQESLLLDILFAKGGISMV